MRVSLNQELQRIGRRETHLWVATLLLLLVLCTATAVSLFIFLSQVEGGATARPVMVRALIGLAVLILLFCAYVMHTRTTFTRIRGLFEAEAVRDSLDDSVVSFVFQPVIDSRTQETIGHEVLSRDPDGRLSVADLFRRYDAVGQLSEFKAMVLRKQIASASANGLHRVFINVDFSMLNTIEPPAKPEDIEIVLEFSEAEVIKNVQQMVEVIGAWRDQGYKFAIDDFGSGFISLPFIAQVMPNFIKMDRSTILEAVESKKYSAFLKDVVAAMRNYSEDGIIAEGVETEEQRSVVESLGVFQMQGHLLGRPQELED